MLLLILMLISGVYVSVQEPSGNHTPPQLSPSLSQAYPNAGSLDVQHLIMQADARRRRNDNYFEDVPRSKLERQMAQVSMVSVYILRQALLCVRAINAAMECVIKLYVNVVWCQALDYGLRLQLL